MGRKSPSERERGKKCDELTALSMQERAVKERLPGSKGALPGLCIAPRGEPQQGKQPLLNHQRDEAPKRFLESNKG